MEFIDYTIQWCRGEILEGRLLALFGLVVTIIATAFWRAGSTPSAQAIVIPLFVVGLLTLVIGISMNVANQKRIADFTTKAQSDELAFVNSEQERTEAFIRWYPITMRILSAVAVGGLLVILIRPTPLARSIGLALVLLALAGLFLDHFSEERAATYHERILDRLK